MTGDTPALRDPRLASLPHEVVRHGPVSSLEEAAEARGVTSRQVIKTMVVRRAEDDFLFVLVPGDRNISWPKLRAHLGVNRLSMPDAEEARRVTGYERGTITPLGSSRDWPVLADTSTTQTGTLTNQNFAFPTDTFSLASATDVLLQFRVSSGSRKVKCGQATAVRS